MKQEKFSAFEICAVVVAIAGVLLGIVVGNEIGNFLPMLFVWAGTFVVCAFLVGMDRILERLGEISRKLDRHASDDDPSDGSNH